MNRGVLIPRPETEIIVEELLKKISFESSKKLLDVGCGCGGYLEYFNSVGFNTKGNDPDEKSATILQGRLQISSIHCLRKIERFLKKNGTT